MDRGACWAKVHGVAELDTTEQLSTAQLLLVALTLHGAKALVWVVEA